MFPRLRSAHVTVVALACAVALGHARGGEPGTKPKMVQKVYAVADLVVPIDGCDAQPLEPPAYTANLIPWKAQSQSPVRCATLCDHCEIMCQQPADEPCCADHSCCPNGSCCPDGPCCPKGGCCEKSVTNWSKIAAPECYSAAKPAPTTESNAAGLIKLITGTVCPDCWTDGNCRIEYSPLGMGLVVSAPPEVQEQVADLLNQLQRLRCTEVTFDVQLVRVADGPAKEALDRATNEEFAGGQKMFLADVLQHAATNDAHAQVISAPKLTMLNGQKAAVRCTDDRFFVTNVNVVKFGGQVVYVPVNSPFPLGFEFSVRPTVSADNRFIRCDLKVEQTDIGSPVVPLFPVSTFITPVFEGGAQGEPIPFTQFIQQPDIAKRGISKALTIPDGGTVVLYAGKQTKADESQMEEPGAPLFDWISDLVDLVHPPAPTPTYEEHLYVLVTPRVILPEAIEAAATPMPVGPIEPAPVIRPCAAMADGPCCPPPPPMTAACPAPAMQPCTVVPCSMQTMASAMPPASPGPQVQLDVCVMCMDPAKWNEPITAVWSDLSPNVCGDKKLLAPEEASRFCQFMKGRGATMLAEPKLVTLCGRPAAFCSGGVQMGAQGISFANGSPEFVHQAIPFGTNISFLADIMPDGVYLQCECELSGIRPTKEYKITIQGPGEEPRTEAVAVVGQTGSKSRMAAAVPAGRTLLLHCGRSAEGKDVIVTVTPHSLAAVVEAAPPPLACPPPPAMLSPTVWSAPAPARDDVQVVTGQFIPPAGTKLDRLMTKYRWACEDGDTAKARKLAEKCLAIDPTCFGK
jgi:hypothetical protein